LERQRLDLERQRAQEQTAAGEAEEQRAQAQASRSQVAVGATRPDALLIFGGPGHKTFIGCICDGEQSIALEGGTYGPQGFNPDNASLWSPFGLFHDRFGDYSACARFVKDPPIVVTPDGRPICRLTIDLTNPFQCKAPSLLEWLSQGPCAP
jgi:hypothetical protein